MDYEKILLQEVNEIRNTCEPVVLWGAGILGQMALKSLKYLGKTPVCFCDMNKELQGTTLRGIPIISVEEAISKYHSSLIILGVGLMGTSYKREEEAKSLARQLKHNGTMMSGNIIHYIYNTKVIKRGISSADYAKTIYNLQHSDNILNRLSIVITDRCTLNCRDCGMLIPYKKPGKDAAVNVIIPAVKKLFSVVDGIRWVQIFGGEPFLHPQLTELTKEVAKINKALSIAVITNATLPPKQAQYNELALYTSYFTLSDYGVSLSRYRDAVCDACESSGMVYFKSNYNSDGIKWCSFGTVDDKKYIAKEKETIFSECMNQECNCRISPDGVFYICERQLLPSIKPIGNNENEMIHLEDPAVTGMALKKKWDYIRHLPYLTACGYCGGSKPVPAAIQAKGKLRYEDMDK